jgi:hypothetical protein
MQVRSIETNRAPVGHRIGGRRARRRRDGRERRQALERTRGRCRHLECVVARTFGFEVADLRGASRGHAPIAFARQVAMYVAHVWFGLSLSEVGRSFGRDRTTVAHACRVVEERRDDPGLDRVIAAIETAADLWGDFVRDLEATA